MLWLLVGSVVVALTRLSHEQHTRFDAAVSRRTCDSIHISCEQRVRCIDSAGITPHSGDCEKNDHVEKLDSPTPAPAPPISMLNRLCRPGLCAKLVVFFAALSTLVFCPNIEIGGVGGSCCSSHIFRDGRFLRSHRTAVPQNKTHATSHSV